MNRPLTAILAALDAVIAVVLGLVLPLVIFTILWAAQFQLGVDWTVFWRASVDLWLLGNGVDLFLAVDPQVAAQLALNTAATPFEVGIAPLGFALLTVFLGRRSGIRLAVAPHWGLGVAVGLVTIAVFASLVCLSAQSANAAPSLGQAIIFVPSFYAIGIAIGLWAEQARRQRTEAPAAGQNSVRQPLIVWWIVEQFTRIPGNVRSLIGLTLRGGAIAAAGIIAIAGIAVTLLLLVHYSEVVSLYESLQSEFLGGMALTLSQIAFMPNFVVWAAAWFIGPGFALGAGSSVSPLGTQLGLIPAVPVLGALPQGSTALGFIGLLVPMAVGFVTASLLRPKLVAISPPRSMSLVATGIGMGLVGACILSLLSIWAGGAAGPGRLAVVGPDPALVWLWSFIELSVSVVIGLVAAGVVRGPRRNVAEGKSSLSS